MRLDIKEAIRETADLITSATSRPRPRDRMTPNEIEYAEGQLRDELSMRGRGDLFAVLAQRLGANGARGTMRLGTVGHPLLKIGDEWIAISVGGVVLAIEEMKP